MAQEQASQGTASRLWAALTASIATELLFIAVLVTIAGLCCCGVISCRGRAGDPPLLGRGAALGYGSLESGAGLELEALLPPEGGESPPRASPPRSQRLGRALALEVTKLPFRSPALSQSAIP